MLVNLANGEDIGAGASQTWSYACDSVQQVFIRCDDDGTDALQGFVTVQIGNETVVNDIDFEALALINIAKTGGLYGAGDTFFKIDLGSHVLEPTENLYVTIRAGVAMTAHDVCAIVNEGGVYEPLKYTNYSDHVFTDTNTLEIYAWANAALDDDTTAFTVRNQSYSSAPLVQDGTLVTRTNCYLNVGGSDISSYLATMAKNQVPMNTSVNYSSTDIDGVVCISAMDKTPTRQRASVASGQAVLASMTSAERKAL